jgi:hypothetical protein
MTDTTEAQAPADESRLRGEPAPHQTNHFSDEEWRRVGFLAAGIGSAASPIMGIFGGSPSKPPSELSLYGLPYGLN